MKDSDLIIIKLLQQIQAGGGGGGGGAPSGPAGGILGGTYPNPSFGTFSSSTLSSAISDETGSGSAVFNTNPTIISPTIADGSGIGNLSPSALSSLLTRSQIDFTPTTITEAATITLVQGSISETTASGTLTTIAFGTGQLASQPITILRLLVTSGPYTITIPTSFRITDSGSTTSLTLATGNHEISWVYDGTKYWMTDSAFEVSVTPTALVGNVNNYSPTGLATASVLRIDLGGASRTITGLDSTTASDGRILRILCLQSTGGTTADTLTISNNNSSSTAANRFNFSGSASPIGDVILAQNSTEAIVYDGTSSCWRPWTRGLVNTGVTAGSYGSSTQVGTYTVGSTGRLTAAGNTTITPADSSITFTDITTGNANTSSHGFQAKGDGNTAHFYRSDNTQTTVSDANLSVTDITTNNVSTSAHGFAPKLDNTITHFLNGQGGWTTPAGSGGSPGGSNTQVQYNNSSAFGGITNATSDGTTLTLTSPKVVTSLLDTNGNTLLGITATASAVNSLNISDTATGTNPANNPVISAIGSDSNIGITLTPKGSGNLNLTSGNYQWPAGTAGTVTTVSPTAAAASQAGAAITISASNATAGTSTAGAAAGGSLTISSGNAARLTSGNANGGTITLNAGAGIGTGTPNAIQLQQNGTTAVRLDLSSNWTPATDNNTSLGDSTHRWSHLFATDIAGTTTNDSAAAGKIGESVSSLIASGSAVSLTTATAANVTSISLTAGDWDVGGNVNFTETTSTVTARTAGINTTSATLPNDGTEAYCGVQSTVTSETNSITLTRKRISLSGTTTVYLVGSATFSAGTCAGFGAIYARRAR